MTGPERSSLDVVFGPRLESELDDRFEVRLINSSGTRENLEAVLANPNVVAFAERSLFDAFVAEDDAPAIDTTASESAPSDGEGEAEADGEALPAPEPQPEPAASTSPKDALEFYGEIPFCALAVTRATSPWALPTEEVPPELKIKVIDAGAETSDSYIGLGGLYDTAPRLSEAVIENRGGSRALARVRSGEVDVAVFLEYPSDDTPVVEQVIDDERLQFVQNMATIFLGADTSGHQSFAVSEILLPEGSGLFDGEQEMRTVCTTVGVVINANADPNQIEAVIYPIVEGELTSDMLLSLDDVSGFFEQAERWVIRQYDEVVSWF